MTKDIRLEWWKKEFDLLSVAYNTSTDDFLLVFNDKLVLNNKIVYGVDFSENRDVVFKDNFAYCIYDTYVDRIDITPQIGKVFKFPIVVHGDGTRYKNCY